MSIFKNKHTEEAIMALYDKKLAQLELPYKDYLVQTTAGETHVVVMGNPLNPPILVLHGINAGAPFALEAIKGLSDQYCLYGIDTVGQATKSKGKPLPIHNGAYAHWLADLMKGLKLEKACFIGVSYGGFILQNMMKHYPEKIEKAFLVVPGGIVNGPFWESMSKLTLPLIKFHLTKKQEDLLKFLGAFVDDEDEDMLTLQRLTLLGVKMDYRRPPLLKAKDVEQLIAPVYVMVAEHDIFFPGEETLKKCKEIFKNMAGFEILKSARHTPSKAQYPKIEMSIRQWLKE